MKVILIGDTATGKTTIADSLEASGLSIVRSYTTREPRDEYDTSHIFISKFEAESITDKICRTIINGNEYFMTNELLKKDIVVIDYAGLKELDRLDYITADTLLVNVICSNKKELQRRWDARGNKGNYECRYNSGFDINEYSKKCQTLAVDTYERRDCYKDILQRLGGYYEV